MNFRIFYAPLVAALVCLPLAGCDTETEGPNAMPPADDTTPDELDVDSTGGVGTDDTNTPGTADPGTTGQTTTPNASGTTTPPGGNRPGQGATPENPAGGTIENEDVTEVQPNQ